MTTNLEVDAYVERSDLWPAEIAALRPILQDCGLTEELKWGKPCYTHAGKNIVILQEMKDFLALMFFKGALLEDPAGVLEEQGPNSRAALRICLRSTEDVVRLADVLSAYVEEAIEAENMAVNMGPAPKPVLVEELRVRLDEDPGFRRAFEGLTPGRQREYNLHFSSAKQAETRSARIEKAVPKILVGKGLRDR